jgi:hypothetical protein
MKKLLQISVLLAFVFSGVPSARSSLITFEGFGDSTPISNQYGGFGVAFTGATILTAGISLFESEFPPKSGANVVYDDGGPLNILFSAPVQQVEAYFTYATKLTLSFFDNADVSVGSITSTFSSNMGLSGDAGSISNELFGLTYLPGIARLTIAGDILGSSFVMDDLNFTPVTETVPGPEPVSVPEPDLLILLGSGLAGLTAFRWINDRRFT